MEDVGGELNAYTTKEETWYYASFMKEYYERSIELLSDIMFNSTLPKKRLKKKRMSLWMRFIPISTAHQKLYSMIMKS